MRDYLQHGMRHAAGGSDPIPGIGGLDLPWGYARYRNTSFASSATATDIDFNHSIGLFGGVTSGDSDITFEDNGTGRQSLVINETGFYLVGVGIYCKISAAPAAGSCVWLDPSWRDTNTPIGHGPAQPFVAAPNGSGDYIADTQAIWTVPVDGTLATTPYIGDIAVTQNSTQTASIEIWEFAVKLSSTAVAL